MLLQYKETEAFLGECIGFFVTILTLPLYWLWKACCYVKNKVF